MKNIKNGKNVLTIVVVIVAIFVVWHPPAKNIPTPPQDNMASSTLPSEISAPSFPDSVFENAVTETDTQKKAIILQGTEMEQALLHKNYATFVDFTYPKVVAIVGGPQKMIALMQESNPSSKILNIMIGDPGDIITAGSELQVTVPTRISMEVTGTKKTGKLITDSTLIAVSTDQGKNWTFIDTSGKNINTLKSVLPNLSTELVIPPMSEPTFYPD